MKDAIFNALSLGKAAGELAVFTIRDAFMEGIDHMLKENEDPYEATWGELSDIASPTGDGPLINGVDRLLTLEDAYKNVIYFGVPGSGKSMAGALNLLLSLDGPSAIVHDPSKQLHGGSSGHLGGACSYSCDIHDMSSPDESSSINPLDFAETPSQVSRICGTLSQSRLEKSQDPFWQYSAQELLSVFANLLVSIDRKYANFANVLQLVQCFAGDAKAVDRLFAKNSPDPLFKIYKSIISSNEKSLASVVMTAKAILEPWSSEDICRTTASTTINVDSFKQGRHALFLRNSTHDAAYNRSALSLIIDQMMGSLMKGIPEKGTLPTYMVLDETSSLALPFLDLALANNRKYAISYILFFQNISQIFSARTQESGNNIVANCFTKIFLGGGMDMRTATDLQNLIGTKTLQTASGKERIVPLMTAQAIRMLDPKKAIIVQGSNKPVLTEMKRYWECPFLKRRAYRPVPKANPNRLAPQKVEMLPL